jgi:hypothetical protein
MLSPIDMLGRRPRARADGFDETALMLDDGTIISGRDSASRAQNALADQVERRRRASRGFYEGERVGHDQKWDAWFGALQAKENYANAHGKRFNVDLMGEGPGSGTGFGRWGARVDGGNTVSLDQPTANQDLAAAAAKAKAAREEQAKRQGQLQRTPQPYTGMFTQPDPMVDALADADEVDDATADAAKRRKTPAPATRRGPGAQRRRPINKPQRGSYTTPR